MRFGLSDDDTPVGSVMLSDEVDGPDYIPMTSGSP
jgi:hypothetical protein